MSECYFFFVIINGFNTQPPVPRTEIEYMHEKYTQAKRSRNELKILNFFLYEKSGETVLKPFTRKDQSSTSFPLSSICLNTPFYCFELVIRRRNSVIILYFFSFLGPFRGSVVREVGTV